MGTDGPLSSIPHQSGSGRETALPATRATACGPVWLPAGWPATPPLATLLPGRTREAVCGWQAGRKGKSLFCFHKLDFRVAVQACCQIHPLTGTPCSPSSLGMPSRLCFRGDTATGRTTETPPCRNGTFTCVTFFDVSRTHTTIRPSVRTQNSLLQTHCTHGTSHVHRRCQARCAHTHTCTHVDGVRTQSQRALPVCTYSGWYKNIETGERLGQIFVLTPPCVDSSHATDMPPRPGT